MRSDRPATEIISQTRSAEMNFATYRCCTLFLVFLCTFKSSSANSRELLAVSVICHSSRFCTPVYTTVYDSRIGARD